VAGVGLALGVELEQVSGHLQQLLLHHRLLLLEGVGAEAIERHRRRVAPGEARDEPHSAHRQVHLVAAGELEGEEVGADAVDLHGDEPGVPADAEVGVHAEVSLAQVLEARGEAVGAAAAPGLAPGARAEDVLVGEHRQAGGPVDEALRHLAHVEVGQRPRVRRGHAAVEGLGVGRHPDAAVEEQATKSIDLPGRAAGHQGGDAVGGEAVEALEEGAQRALFAVVAADRLAELLGAPEVEARRGLLAHVEAEAAALHHPEARERLLQRLARQEVGGRRERQLEASHGVGVAALELGEELLDHPILPGRLIEPDDGRGVPRGEVGEHRVEAAGEEAREQALEAGGAEALPDLLEALADLRGGNVLLLGGVAERGLGGGLGGGAEEELSGGQQHERRHPVDGALAVGVEAAHRLHGVSEELQAHRALMQCGEDVEDVAAHTEGARILHQGCVAVAHLHQLQGQLIAPVLLGQRHPRRELAHDLEGHHPPHQRPHRQHQRREGGSGGQVEEGLQSIGDHGLVGHELVPGQHLVGGQADHAGRVPAPPRKKARSPANASALSSSAVTHTSGASSPRRRRDRVHARLAPLSPTVRARRPLARAALRAEKPSDDMARGLRGGRGACQRPSLERVPRGSGSGHLHADGSGNGMRVASTLTPVFCQASRRLGSRWWAEVSA